ncbi:hypothetical protein [Algibacter sp. 2305UL17-15]|uniref:hypothetical protein n=1 Tax=Algibacter sp. 2305UL17-15 TaxID=3231268 RepID=UPI00345A1C1F
MMRNFFGIIFIIAFSLTSCSSSDNDSGNSNSTINPPIWIQGTWLLEGSNAQSGYRFANDDFCLVLLTTQNCFKESIRLTENSGAITNIKEQITDNNYSIEITLASQILTYNFKKVTETQIEWTNSPLGDLTQAIYLKQ